MIRSVALVAALGLLGACTASAPADLPSLPSRDFPATGGSGVCDADGDGVDGPDCRGLDCDDGNRSVHPGAVESCGNGVDDDCDGITDEDCGCTPGDRERCWEGDASARGVGACSDGVRSCGPDGVWSTCAFAITSSPEAPGCDGVDSDCNGVVDPDPACNGCPAGAVEICGNGLDDDCDGTIDPADLCTVSCDDVDPRGGDPGNLGCCLREPFATHEFQCHEGGGLAACADRACLDLDGDTDTRCSKLCDGDGCSCGRRQPSGNLAAVADCGFLAPCARVDCGDRQNQPCYSGPPATLGLGICRAGIHSCTLDQGLRSWTECVGEQRPLAEVCGNGIDDDCDGNIDEGDGATGRRCPARADCAENAAEFCGNGLDDDCDGFADEGCAPTAGRQACWTGPIDARGVGACKDGAQTDEGGTWGACTGEMLPTAETCGDGVDADCNGLGGPGAPEEPSCCIPEAETCNGLDDDCDGMADQGLLNRCGQCAGTGSCYGVVFDDVGTCDRPGRSCAGVEPSRLDPSLITLVPQGGGGGGGGTAYLYGTRYQSNPFSYQGIAIDPGTGEVAQVFDFGNNYTTTITPAPDGSFWAAHTYHVEHFASDGTVLCRTDPEGTGFISDLASDPGGDTWVLWSPPTSFDYAIRRLSGTDVLAEQSPGVAWPDGVPRCAIIDLDPAGTGTDLTATSFGAILADRQDRLWSLNNSSFVWDSGTITNLPQTNDWFVKPVLAPDGSVLVNWPLRRIDLEGFLAGEAGAIKPLGNYSYDIGVSQGLADGTVAALLNKIQDTPKVVHVDADGAELGRYEVPPNDAGFTSENLAVDGAGMVWTGQGSKLFRLDLASGTWDTFVPGGSFIYVSHHVSGAVATPPSRGTWSQVVDPGTWTVAWGQLSWDASANKGDRVNVVARFSDDEDALAASTIVCGPFASSPADLASCSKGRRYAQVEIELRGSGQPVAGNVQITWDRP